MADRLHRRIGCNAKSNHRLYYLHGLITFCTSSLQLAIMYIDTSGCNAWLISYMGVVYIGCESSAVLQYSMLGKENEFVRKSSISYNYYR